MFVRKRDIIKTEAELNEVNKEIEDSFNDEEIEVLEGVKYLLEKKLKEQKKKYKKFTKLYD